MYNGWINHLFDDILKSSVLNCMNFHVAVALCHDICISIPICSFFLSCRENGQRCCANDIFPFRCFRLLLKRCNAILRFRPCFLFFVDCASLLSICYALLSLCLCVCRFLSQLLFSKLLCLLLDLGYVEHYSLFLLFRCSFLLSVAEVGSQGELHLFKECEVGTRLYLFTGSRENMIQRLASTGRTVLHNAGFRLSEVRGALTWFASHCCCSSSCWVAFFTATHTHVLDACVACCFSVLHCRMCAGFVLGAPHLMPEVRRSAFYPFSLFVS